MLLVTGEKSAFNTCILVCFGSVCRCPVLLVTGEKSVFNTCILVCLILFVGVLCC